MACIFLKNSDGCSVTVYDSSSSRGISGSDDLVIPESVSYDGITLSSSDIGYYGAMDSEILGMRVILRNLINTLFRPIAMGDLVIPDAVTYKCKTYQVTSIGEWAFKDCRRMKSIVIGNSVTSIGRSAFQGCGGLTSVTIPNSVTTIHDMAFNDCSGLTSVTIPNSVTSIGKHAFCECSGLTSVTIPNSVTSIGTGTFSGCSGLTSVTIPNSVTTIGEQAFCGCRGLTSVTIPNSVTFIDDWAFDFCRNLSKVSLPTSIKRLGDHPFPSSLCDLYVHWNDPIYISQSVFEFNYKNTTLHVPAWAAQKYYISPWINFKAIRLHLEGME